MMSTLFEKMKKDELKQDDLYSTDDFQEMVYLITCKYDVYYITKNHRGHATFLFRRDDNLSAILEDWKWGKTPLKTYSENIYKVKEMIDNA